MSKNLPAGVEFLFGNVFRCKLSVIQTADAAFDIDATQLQFRNPRWIHRSGAPIGEGFRVHEMSELREAIQQEGLNQTLRCRWVPFQNPRTDPAKAIQLVDGERRFRSLSKLVADGSMCWDATEQVEVEAKVLYEYVECRVTEMNDETALSFAFRGNDTAQSIGVGATVGLVHHLRKCGMSDQEILKITNKSPDWLLKTEKLFGLDDDTFAALCDGLINRSVARLLGRMKDPDKRKIQLQDAIDASNNRIAQMKTELQEAEEQQDLAEAEVVVASDSKTKEIAEAQLKRAEKKVKRRRSGLARPRVNMTSGKDMQTSGAELPKPLTMSKMQKHVYLPCKELIKCHCKDKEGNDLDIDIEDVRLLVAFWDMREKGVVEDEDPTNLILPILLRHNKAKQKRAE